MANASKAQIEMARKAGVALLYLLGTMLCAFNLLAFTADKYGLYYKDENQWWFATGAAFLLVAWLYRNWQKL